MSGLPDPARSRAVLIGVADYVAGSGYGSLPAVRNNLTDLAEVLMSRDLWGLPSDNCLTLVNPAGITEILKAVHTASQAAEDFVFVYFAGHGIYEPGELRLALPAVSSDTIPYDTVQFSGIRTIVNKRHAKHAAIVLDCCYSGTALLGSVNSAVLAELERASAFTLTSSEADLPSIAPAGDRHTAFTGALLEVLGAGLGNGAEYLTLGDIAHAVDAVLKDRRRPRSAWGQVGDGYRIPLVRNRSWRPPVRSAAGIALPDDFPVRPAGERRRLAAAAVDGVREISPIFASLLLAIAVAPGATEAAWSVVATALAGVSIGGADVREFLVRAAPLILTEGDSHRLRYPDLADLLPVDARHHSRGAEALISLAETHPDAYTSRFLSHHVALGGVESLRRLAEHETVLDGLDPLQAARDLWPVLIRSGPALPAEIVGAIASGHQSGPRRIARQLAMARYAGTRTFEGGLRMARLVTQPAGITIPTADVRALAPAGDGTVAVGLEDGTIRLFDPATARLGEPVVRFDDTMWSLYASRDRIVAGFADGTVRVWGIDGTEQACHVGHTEEVLAVFIINEQVGSVSYDCTVRMWPEGNGFQLWDVPNAACLVPFAASRDIAETTVVAIGSDAGEIRLWDPVSRAYVATLAGHTSEVTALGVAGSTLLSASDDDTIRFWDLGTGRQIGPHIDRIPSVSALCGVDDLVAVGYRNGDVEMLDPVSHQTLSAFDPGYDFDGVAGACAVGRTLVLGAEGRLHAATEPGRVARGDRSGSGVSASAVISLPHRLLATGGDEGVIRFWDTVSGTEIGAPLRWEYDGLVWTLRTLTTGGTTLLVAGHREGVLRTWDLAAGVAVGRPMVVEGTYALWDTCAVATASGLPVLAVGGSDGLLHRWHAATGEPLGRPLPVGDIVDTVCPWRRPGGQPVILTGSRDGYVRAWDPETGANLSTHHVGQPVSALRPLTLPDGTPATALAYGNGGACVWNPATGSPTTPDFPLDAPEAQVLSVLQTGYGPRLAVVRGASLEFWDPTTQALATSPIHTELPMWAITDADGGVAAAGPEGFFILDCPGP